MTPLADPFQGERYKKLIKNLEKLHEIAELDKAIYIAASGFIHLFRPLKNNLVVGTLSNETNAEWKGPLFQFIIARKFGYPHFMDVRQGRYTEAELEYHEKLADPNFKLPPKNSRGGKEG